MFKKLKKLDDHVQSVGNRYSAYRLTGALALPFGLR
jgi:hypothetical protein